MLKKTQFQSHREGVISKFTFENQVTSDQSVHYVPSDSIYHVTKVFNVKWQVNKCLVVKCPLAKWRVVG